MMHKNEALYTSLKDYVQVGIKELARIAALQMSDGSEANFYARFESGSVANISLRQESAPCYFS
jgi:hypothetical protein